MNCPITTKLILEPGKEEGDPPIVEVNKKLIQKLKPHQVEAVQFMWDCMFESVKRSKKEEGAGCILAHCMGLGKTLSVISFVHTILSHSKVLNQKTCLVVSPLNTVLNWQNEWGLWLDEEDQLDVWELASCKQNPARADMLKEWHASGGVMIIGYEMYRNLSQGARCKNKRQKKIFFETLVNPGPDMVICDEGHILKNEMSSISKAMNQMKTRRRVVLTGTPLQNNLNEYHCMLSFVKPNLLGTRKEFNNRFISPIQNGQCTDSTQRDVKLMKARAHVLHEMLAGCVQRRDYSALTKFLPPKQEYVISVRLTDVQIDLYEKYLQMSGQGVDGIFTNKGARLFSDYQNLMKIWTHPWVLKLAEIRDEQKMKYDDEDSFIDDESEAERSFSSSDSSSEEEKLVLSDSGGEGTSLGPHSKKGTRRTRAKARYLPFAGEDSDPEEVIAEWKSKTRNGEDNQENEKVPEGPKSVTKEWWAAYVTEEDQHKVELSNKLFLLFEILKMCEEIGDKVLIFSQSILSLNIIESFLETIDSKFQQECEEMKEGETKDEKEEFGRSWTKNLDYYRMDGSTSAQNRQLWAANFNDIENHRTRLFLISTKAGGLGINLVAANRVIIFDASWNPSHDVQSIFRVYRFGQTKPCYIYRFLAQGTMEEKIYERQVTKLSLSQRVVDEHQIERHFSANDLKELYNFRPDRWNDGTEKPTLSLPKDPLLAEILTNHKHCVLSFHEHDSLLENQIEQTLTEEEKKAAWEEYENEKKGIIIRGPGMQHTASWPMMAAAQILSREQITATVQALRQRMEMLRMQEIQIMNMIKYQAQQSGLSYEEVQNQMAPWIQMQMQQMHRMRAAMQGHLMAAGTSGMHPSSSLPMMGNMGGTSAERISNNPEDAIDLDEN
ncbi:alpha thalassemia/mental retardation syndrome X-linked homolog [Elysia marginata]|uniref:Alpha thalassemia/mental retardation syndrome X-linked homolog n=1 Tax=Elysia marginata TaxID=1093978 RepID=A0AAV4JHP8_9GAST|nr:alpha thalassemia/mental retardation syndrome X-linked homolog [Elysia marginata]